VDHPGCMALLPYPTNNGGNHLMQRIKEAVLDDIHTLERLIYFSQQSAQVLPTSVSRTECQQNELLP